MITPLHHAIQSYIDTGFSRFHMPGHNGVGSGPLADVMSYDLTELPGGLEGLYEGTGAIAEVESLYRKVYGTKASFLSAGGSTLCVQAMLTLACPPGSKIIAARGVHTSAVSAMGFLDLNPVWLMPKHDEESGLVLPVSPESVCKSLAANSDAKAVYITSPSYYGQITDIEKISAVCRKYNVPLLCDNAHGAHLKFMEQQIHPAQLGADMCCDSLHKTLPALTGAALLHIQNERFILGARHAMSLFGSTSPSFLILLSADLLLPYLSGGVCEDMRLLCETIAELRLLARDAGFIPPVGQIDPIRLTLGFRGAGVGKSEFEQLLRENQIAAEYIDREFCVFIAGTRNTNTDFERVRSVILSAKRNRGYTNNPPLQILLPNAACSVRQAMFSPTHTVNISDAPGKIAGAVVSVCPPGVPVLIPGEIICEDIAVRLKDAGISFVDVLQ